MFAHQVIEEFNAAGRTGLIAPYAVGFMKHSLSLISKSQKFFFGRTNGVYRPFKMGGNLFYDNRKYIKLPYDVVWLDYLCDPQGKIGILMFNAGEHLTCRIFKFVTAEGHWDVFPGEVHIYPEEKAGISFCFLTGLPWSKEKRDETENACVPALTLAECSILLLNCKNIETQNIPPPHALNRARNRKGKQELFAYKILRIKKAAVQRGGNHPPGDDHNRIHFCRGHFKEYTEEHPLFGKITGLWWWQPHVRGQNKDGIVMKDYEIAP